MAAEKIEVISIKEFREEFDEYFIPRFTKKIIEETDKRYFTREKIYLFAIGALTMIVMFAWQHSNLVNEVKELEGKRPNVHQKKSPAGRYTDLYSPEKRSNWGNYILF